MQRFPECSAVTLYIFDILAEITGTFLSEEAPLGFDSSSPEFFSLVFRFVQQETTLVTTSQTFRDQALFVEPRAVRFLLIFIF